jgi:hypothetical protein
MRSIKEYIAESTKEHAYILKMAVEPSEAQVNTVELLLRSYDIVHFSKLLKVQDERFDFFDVPSRDVWSIRFVTKQPISSYVLQQRIREELNIPEKYIVVRTSNEPVEVEAEDERFKELVDKTAADDGLVAGPRLSIKSFYNNAEQPAVTDLYGDNYNKNFLNYLANVKSERPTDEVDAPAPLFSWIAMNKFIEENGVEQVDFNAHIDTPKPVMKAKGKQTEPVIATALGSHGNLDDGAMNNVRLLKDPKTGKETAVVAPRASKKAKG